MVLLKSCFKTHQVRIKNSPSQIYMLQYKIKPMTTCKRQWETPTLDAKIVWSKMPLQVIIHFDNHLVVEA